MHTENKKYDLISFLRRCFSFMMINNRRDVLKKYGHIISLGYNCEVSFQFFQKYKFVESSLFAWTNSINIDNLLYALSNLQDIGASTWVNTCPMWKCSSTNILFHGKAPMKIWKNNPSSEIIEADRKDLEERVAHLKNKFVVSLHDGKKTLFIYKIAPNDIQRKDIVNKLDELYKLLSTLCKNTFDLLIVIEEKNYDLLQGLKSYDNLYVRCVHFFTNENDVTSKINDKKGWEKIFSEFTPNFKLKKSKKFKFEEV